MLASQVPNFFPLAFAANAGAGYTRPIPTNSQIGLISGAASLKDGFPPLCFQPVESGGVPPFGQDFNGLLNQITAGLQWLQIGGLAVYNPALQTAIGGYPNGAVLIKASGNGLWISTTDNNLTDPDTGGTGWADLLVSYVKNDGHTYGISITGNAATATSANTAVSALTANTANTATTATSAASATVAGTASNAATQPVGTNSTAIASTAFVNQEAFGVGGQTWQNVTGSRSLGIAYTNSTGRPIEVSVSSANAGPGNGGAIVAIVGGVQVAQDDNYNINYQNHVCFIVPPGAIYQVNNNGTTNQTLNLWSECR
jgi:hypothetical protein